ncbi:MAG: hypothetical protein K8I27_12040 [Planctomycetes bacterium]|nr:hypothetical protein [Planctomycetota bacterium]
MRLLRPISLLGFLLTSALIASACPGGPGQLNVPDHVTLQAAAGGELVSTQLRVDGSFCEYAKVQVEEEHAAWLSVTPGKVKLEDSVTIVANPRALAAGQYEGEIKLFPDRGSGLWTVKVLLTVAPQKQPGE